MLLSGTGPDGAICSYPDLSQIGAQIGVQIGAYRSVLTETGETDARNSLFGRWNCV